MHDNQLDISAAVVRALIDRQFPQWRSLPVRPVAASGTVNAIFRIGDRYTARFPLEAGDADTVRRSLEAEAEAAAELAGRTRFQTPEPIALGEPGAGYPLPWSVQTWLPGTVATDADPGDSAAFALDLAEFIAARPVHPHPRPDVLRPRPRRRPARRTTTGWRRASCAVRECSTSPGCAGGGRRCGTCRAVPPRTS